MTAPKDDEIDLFQLAGRFLSLIKQRKILISSFMVLGLAGGFLCILLLPGKYNAYCKQEFVIHSSVVTDGILSDIVNNLSFKMDSVAGFRKIEAKLQVNANKETKLKLIIWADGEGGIAAVKGALTQAVDTMTQLKEKYLSVKKSLEEIASKFTGHTSLFDSLPEFHRMDSVLQSNLEMFDVGQKLAAHKIIEFIDIASPVIYESNMRLKILTLAGYLILGFVIGILCAYYAPKAVTKV